MKVIMRNAWKEGKKKENIYISVERWDDLILTRALPCLYDR